MVVQSEGVRPVMVGLQYFFKVAGGGGGGGGVRWGEIMAYLSLVTLPVLILYLALQRAFVESIASSGREGMTHAGGPMDVPETTVAERSFEAARPTPSHARQQAQRRLMYGCMSLGGDADGAPLSSRDMSRSRGGHRCRPRVGITMFDHADVYRRGKAEAVFGRILRSRPGLREQLVIQSKCGVRLDEDGVAVQYDLSKAWILRAVDESSARLQLRVPGRAPAASAGPTDALRRGRRGVRRPRRARARSESFGVSNMSAAQMRELQRHLPSRSSRASSR